MGLSLPLVLSFLHGPPRGQGSHSLGYLEPVQSIPIAGVLLRSCSGWRQCVRVVSLVVSLSVTISAKPSTGIKSVVPLAATHAPTIPVMNMEGPVHLKVKVRIRHHWAASTFTFLEFPQRQPEQGISACGPDRSTVFRCLNHFAPRSEVGARPAVEPPSGVFFAPPPKPITTLLPE